MDSSRVNENTSNKKVNKTYYLCLLRFIFANLKKSFLDFVLTFVKRSKQNVLWSVVAYHTRPKVRFIWL